MNDTTHELVLDRTLDAPRENVWRCWVETDLLEQWFCPKPWFANDFHLDLRPGGEFSSVFNGPDGERLENPGVLLEVQDGKRLVFTDAFTPGWRPNGKPFMIADVRFEDTGDGRTRYTATARHWNAETLKEHQEMGFHEGWGKAADQLEALAKSL